MTIEQPSRNSSTLLKQGIEWIRFNQSSIAEAYAEVFTNLSSDFYRNTPEERRIQSANASISGLIGRLEGKAYDSTKLRQNFEQMLTQGVSAEDLTFLSDAMLKIFIDKISQDETLQEDVRKVLLHKITYVSSLTKTSLAAAIVNVQARKNL